MQKVGRAPVLYIDPDEKVVCAAGEITKALETAAEAVAPPRGAAVLDASAWRPPSARKTSSSTTFRTHRPSRPKLREQAALSATAY